MPNRYWDSNAFLGWLAEEPDKVDECKAVIRSCEDGKTKLVTSALTLAEVLWIRGEERIEAESAEMVQRFFEHEWIIVSDLDRRLAEGARQLVWGKDIHPRDAIHVATALDAEVERMETFDDRLINRSGSVGDPPLEIGRPNEPEALF